MKNELPLSLKNYIDAVNRHDVDAMLRAFSKKATVRDEGKTYTGTRRYPRLEGGDDTQIPGDC